MDGGATLEREFESTQQAVDRTAGTSMFHLDQQARMIHEGEQMITVCYLPREAPDWAAAHGGRPATIGCTSKRQVVPRLRRA